MTQKKEQGKEAHKDERNHPVFHPGGVWPPLCHQGDRGHLVH